MNSIRAALVLAALLAGCASAATPQATAPTTRPPTAVPTNVPTTAPMPTNSPTETPSHTRTATPPIAPAPTVSPDQVCANLAAESQRGLVVLYVEPAPRLTWDQTPRQFRVGVCNTLSVPTVPQGQFVLFVYIAWTRQIRGQTSELPAQLAPGFHELVLGPWTPGLENHVTACAQRPAVEIEIGYNDSFPQSSSFRPVPWADGITKIVFPIACGGDYP